MKQLHRQEKEQFKKLFKEERIDQFDDRFKVLEAFLQTEQHVTAAGLAARVAALISDPQGTRRYAEAVGDALEPFSGALSATMAANDRVRISSADNPAAAAKVAERIRVSGELPPAASGHAGRLRAEAAAVEAVLTG